MAGPISPTLITPTPTLNFAAGASGIKDDAIFYDIPGTISPPAGTAFPIRISFGGTGTYDLDWMVRGLNANDEFLVQPGSSAFSIRLLINENHDTSETYIPTIANNGYYLIGPTGSHAVTCTLGTVRPHHGTPGTAGYVGHDFGSTGSTTVANWTTQQDGDSIENHVITGVATIRHKHCRMTNCWTKGVNATNHGIIRGGGGPEGSYDDFVADRCTVGGVDPGGVPMNGTGPGIDNEGDPVSGWTFRNSYIGMIAEDGIRKLKGSLFDYCLIEKLGGKDASAHADLYQWYDLPAGTDISTTFRQSYLFLPGYNAPDYPGEPYRINGILQLDTDAGAIAGNMLYDRCWIDGGHEKVMRVGRTLHTYVRGCRIGNQNKAWFDSGGAEPTKDQVLDHMFESDGAGYVYHCSGNKWGGDRLALPYAGTPFDLNNEPVWS